MIAENKVVHLEEIRNEKMELATKVKKEMDAYDRFRLNNILEKIVAQDRHIKRMEEIMEEMVDIILEK